MRVRVSPWQLQDQPEHSTESLLWDWWIMNDIEIALRNAHFRYRGSIEYRDTRDGIVIVAPISGIAQHYPQAVC